MFKSGKTISMKSNTINKMSFEAGEGSVFEVNGHKVTFTPNPNDTVKAFTCDSAGHVEFDYHDKHYTYDVAKELTVVLGEIAEFN
jgi:phage gp45-like